MNWYMGPETDRESTLLSDLIERRGLRYKVYLTRENRVGLNSRELCTETMRSLGRCVSADLSVAGFKDSRI